MKYLAATLVSLTYVAGYLHGIHWTGHAYALGGVCVFGLGILFARAQQGSTFAVVESANSEALTVYDVISLIHTRGDYSQSLPLYSAASTSGIHRVTSAFVARIDDRQGLILETS